MLFTAEIQRNPTKNGSWCCRAKFFAEFVGPGLLPLPRLGSCPGHPGVSWAWKIGTVLDNVKVNRHQTNSSSWKITRLFMGKSTISMGHFHPFFSSLCNSHYQRVDIQIRSVRSTGARRATGPIFFLARPVDPTQLLAESPGDKQQMLERHLSWSSQWWLMMVSDG